MYREQVLVLREWWYTTVLTLSSLNLYCFISITKHSFVFWNFIASKVWSVYVHTVITLLNNTFVCECVHRWVCVCVHSVMSNSLWPHGLQPARLLCPWNFSGKNIGAGCHFLLQGIYQIQGLNMHFLCLLHWQADSLPLCFLVSPNNAFTFSFF